MKKILLLLVSIFSFVFIQAQERQEGLLWKISGNNLEKPSYIYGNMHVSGKIAFHLGEEFFTAISSADKIALESNPIVWLDEIFDSEDAADYIGRYAVQMGTREGFYKNSFEAEEIDNDDLARVLSQEHYFMNWMLYRSARGMSDFEEETFLDMFIYQSGAKNGKEVISLENFLETNRFSDLASIPDIEDKERSKWFKDLTREKRYGDLLEEAYRTQDLSMIDSLKNEVTSNNYMYWMIYKRNELMAQKIDSIIQSGTTLFSGVGAAHLPGDKGMLRLLEAMGYTLEPMSVTFSDKAKQTREEYNKKKLAPKESFLFESDLFSIETAAKVYETPYTSRQRHFFGPELTNGSYYTIKQISTYAPLNGKSIDDYIVKIDSLLFENIPGKIEKKTTFEGDFFKGIDILNKTKNGDYQRTKIYITAMNIFIFKLGGKDEYVLDYGDKFFNSIKLKQPTNNWVKTTTINNDISINLPENTSITYNKKVVSLYGQPIIESYNTSDSSYYLLKRKSIYDWVFIEQDSFELKRIAEQFFIKMKLDTVDASMIPNSKYPSAIAYNRGLDSSYLAIKVLLRGPYFYMLLAKTNTYQASNKFFDSFEINDFSYLFDYKTKIDSSMLFSVNSNYLYPKGISYMRSEARKKKNNKNNTKDTEYKQKITNATYYSETFERVHVKTKRYKHYQHYSNLDSLWNYETELIADDDEELNFLIVKSKRKAEENGLSVYYATFADTSSSRNIMVKFILKHGVLYRIKSISDSSETQSKFVKNFFDTFTPFDTNIGYSPLVDKSTMFMKNIYSTDSLTRTRAYKSATYLHFEDEKADSLKHIINTYKFPANFIETKKDLISTFVTLNQNGDNDYIESLYKAAGDTAMYQLQILQGLAWGANKKNIKTYLKLLDYDIPISSSKWENKLIFYPFSYSKAGSKAFPELLDYTFISQYRDAIIEVLADQVDSNKIKTNVYKSNVNQLLREAKIVLKEQISKEQSAQSDGGGGYRSYYSTNYKNKDNELLVNYIRVLMPYYKSNKKVGEFIDKIGLLQNFNIRTKSYCLQHKRYNNVDTAIWSILAADEINLSLLYLNMKEMDILKDFPTQHKKQQLIAQSLLFDSGVDFKKDSVEYLGKRMANTGRNIGWVYFFKTKQKDQDDWKLNYIGFQPADENEVSLDESVKRTRSYIDKAEDINDIIDERIDIINVRNHPYADGSWDK